MSGEVYVLFAVYFWHSEGWTPRNEASNVSCEGEGDVVGVEAPLGGVAQVIFHGVLVVEVGVQVRVHQDRGVEEDGEGQGEVEREDEEVRESRTSWMTCRWSDGLKELEPRGS